MENSDQRPLPPFKRAVQWTNNEQEQSKGAAVPDDYACFGLAANQERSFGFKMYFGDGNIAAIYYHDLISPMTYDPEGVIGISLPTATITVIGRNLRPLFDYYFESRVTWVKEPDSSFTHAEKGQPEIERIKIEQNG